MNVVVARITRLAVVSLAACSVEPNTSNEPIVGAYEIRLDLELENQPLGCAGPSYATVWWLVADFPAGEATGWFSVTGVEVDGTRKDVPATRSVSAQSSTEDGVTLSPFTIQLTDLAGSLSFESIVLRSGSAPGELTGEVHGELTERSGNSICTFDMEGSVRGQRDESAPRLMRVPELVAPFDPIAMRFVEPVMWSAVATITPTANFASSPDMDLRPGFVVGTAIQPAQLWPAASTLHVTVSGLVDATGNVADHSFDVRTIAEPDSNSNTGFEAIDPYGWTTQGDAYVATGFDCVGTSTTAVTPPQGSAMILLDPAARVIGFLQPPPTASALELSIGLCDQTPVRVLQDADRGLDVEIITASERVRIAGSKALPRPSDASASWTGFGTIHAPLPASAATGFWLVVRSMGAQPPVHFPRILVDAVRFTMP